LENIQVVKATLKLTQKTEGLIKFVEDRLGHDMRYSIDTEKIRKMGWRPETRFEDGIERTVKWYRQHPDWWKPVIDKEQIDFHKELP
jgi:dTDP-glucose 4,6-dehydratase